MSVRNLSPRHKSYLYTELCLYRLSYNAPLLGVPQPLSKHCKAVYGQLVAMTTAPRPPEEVSGGDEAVPAGEYIPCSPAILQGLHDPHDARSIAVAYATPAKQ